MNIQSFSPRVPTKTQGNHVLFNLLHVLQIILNRNLMASILPFMISPNFSTTPQICPHHIVLIGNVFRALPLPWILLRVIPSIQNLLIYWQRLFHSPARINESPMLELSWAWELANSSRACRFSTGTIFNGVFSRNMAGRSKARWNL